MTADDATAGCLAALGSRHVACNSGSGFTSALHLQYRSQELAARRHPPCFDVSLGDRSPPLCRATPRHAITPTVVVCQASTATLREHISSVRYLLSVVSGMSKLVDKLTTEEMIAEVKRCDVLWDPTLEAYQNKHLRTKAWRNIMTALIPHLHTMTSAEQSEIGK